MRTRTLVASLPRIVAAALLAAACTDAVSPERLPPRPEFSHTASGGIVLDQQNGSLGEFGTVLIKGFDPTNPHRGSTIIATFYWVGATNVIDSVTDHLSDAAHTPIPGNPYTLVEYVTAGGLSMATYVATNIQGFPDPNPPTESVYVVRANLSMPVLDGGVKISAWTGVEPVLAQALGAHRSASGSGSSETIVAPGAISLNAGALAYAVTMTNGRVGFQPPEGFTSIGGPGSDFVIKEDGRYLVRDSAGTVDPRWTWFFETPSTWLATVLALNPAVADSVP